MIPRTPARGLSRCSGGIPRPALSRIAFPGPARRPSSPAARRVRTRARPRVRKGIRPGSHRRHRSGRRVVHWHDVDVDRRAAIGWHDVDALLAERGDRTPTSLATSSADRPVFCCSRPHSYSLVNRYLAPTISSRAVSPSRRASCWLGSAPKAMPPSRQALVVADHRARVVGTDQHQVGAADRRGRRPGRSRSPATSRQHRKWRAARASRRWCT